MAASDEDVTAHRILWELDASVSSSVNKTRKFVDEFKRNLEQDFPRINSVIKVSLTHGGSAYEGLAVSENADFDITVLLGDPFKLENFHVERDQKSDFFTLRWKSHLKNKILCNRDYYLKAADLREKMLTDLHTTIDNMYLASVKKIDIKHWLTSLAVEIHLLSGSKISIDVVPQVAFRSWNQCPDLKQISELSRHQRQYIDKINKNKSPVMCFALAVPDKENYSRGDFLFNISFSLLEKEFFKANTEIRDMVRLVKFVADRRGWKEKPLKFKSYYAKRVAIKYDKQLKTKNLWDGFRALLRFLRSDLDEIGTIDGFYVGNQVTYRKDRSVLDKFIREIDSVLYMSAKEVKDLLNGNVYDFGSRALSPEEATFTTEGAESTYSCIII
ncbi:hypothetical protein SK128_002875 [Halocaridina rubra]|uniref:Mab-21-like nucleotidyltransferase domain-containing protein n=1 Tax=Halocaridina rubra TaxID=373956 RepID=A0AAN8WXX0_HALRR